MIYFSELTRITGGENLLYKQDRPIATLALDSRKISADKEILFLAIKGDRHDGHDYLVDLYNKGIRQFIIERPGINTDNFPDANMLLVSSTVEALQKLARYHRKKFQYPVIGITGSNGKTIIKEWLTQMLSKDRVVVKNPASFNSQVGVPLSVWQMQAHHQIAIFEAGISQPGEMEKLQNVIQPTIGIFSNLGTAHDEGFVNRGEKLAEKLKLFRDTQALIYCTDHEVVDQAVRKTGMKTFTWGTHGDVNISFQNHACSVSYGNGHHTFQLPFTDSASKENCAHCITLMLYLGYPFKQIQRGINDLRSVPMRMEMKEGINQSYIIDDTYNNDLGGLELSLQFLTHQNQKKKKRLILSDIHESGLPAYELALKIASFLERNGVSDFIGVGPILANYKSLFPIDSHFYDSTQAFLDTFNFESIYQEVILVKGARSFAFEKIVSRLQRKVHGTVMEIDLGSLVHNLNFFKSRLRPTTKVMVMVKAFAYGSSSPEVANVLQYHKVDYLGVAYADEGIDLRKNNITLPIMVMNPTEDSFDSLISFNLEPEIYNFKIFRALLRYLGGRSCTIHIKLDTGMHRLGFEKSDVPEIIDLLRQHPNLYVASIFSHLAGADEDHHDKFSNLQAAQFRDWADLISEALEYKPLYHLLNSPGILRLPNLQFDMVRLGIGLYGVDPTKEDFKELKPVATLKTIVSQIKRIAKGESIGYGRRGIAQRDLELATIAIGYADGFSRAQSQGQGEVLIKNNRAEVVGNVCMDMTMVDVTGMGAAEGDEVIIFGNDLPIQEVAAKIKTIPYELLTNVSQRVKRVFIAQGL